MLDRTGQWKERLKHRIRTRLSPESTQTLKKVVNGTVEMGLWGRGLLKQLGGEHATVNVYHACIQKTGSQWISAVFRDPRTREASGLSPFPQFRYEWGEMRTRFPPHTYVPGLYISRGLYDEIEKPEPYRTIYVVRDPRDTVVSWYHSMRDSHRLMGKVHEHRRALVEMSVSEGISYCIRQFQLKLSFVRSWLEADDDAHVKFVRLEDLADNPFEGYRAIMDHCQIDIGDAKLEEVLKDYTKEKMRERDLEVRGEDAKSHYRRGGSDWREVFTEEHERLFRQVNGNLVELMGYEW